MLRLVSAGHFIYVWKEQSGMAVLWHLRTENLRATENREAIQQLLREFKL